MKIVLDTNVLVSGLLNPYGPPGQITQMIPRGDFTLCFDARILAEYREVLARPRFSFDEGDVDTLLNFIEVTGHLTSTVPLAQQLPDPDDDMFLEVAIGAQAACIVTGNHRHFPASQTQGMLVLSPREFVDSLRQDED